MDKTQFPQQSNRNLLTIENSLPVPQLIRTAGNRASERFIEFFTARIRNHGTRTVYARAVRRFCNWCEAHQLRLETITPFVVAAYIEQLQTELKSPTVKLHLSAIRMLFDDLVIG